MATKSFVTYSPASGNGDATINVNASSHSDYMEGRSISLSIKGQGITKTIEITQKEYWVKSNGFLKQIQYGNINNEITYTLEEYNLQSSSTEKSLNGWMILRFPIGFSGTVNWEFQQISDRNLLSSSWRQYWYCKENSKQLLLVRSTNGMYIPNLNNLDTSYNGDYIIVGGSIASDTTGAILAPSNMVLTLIIS